MEVKNGKKYVNDNEQLMKEWAWERNTNVEPSKITNGSHKKVWWRCTKGHEWEASVEHRNKGRGCPYCAGRYVIKGYNDLQTVNPDLAKEWNYEKNNGLTPEDVFPNSDKKAWWKCNKAHQWQASIASRNKNHGCPYCSGRYAIVGESDLQTVNPTLAKEWNYEKNNDLKPENVTAGSGKKVWWICRLEHEGQATIASRNSGTGCPYCSGNKILKGYNDLQTVNPILALEWNYEKNSELTPADVMPNSDKKVWWKCSKGHEWQSSVGHRNKGRRCPQCAKKSSC